MSRSAADDHRAAFNVVLLLALVTYGYFHAPAAWNETSRFDLTRSIVERGRFDIDEYHDNTGDKALRGGHYYTDKAPGASLLAVPSYAVYYAFLRLAHRELPAQITGSTPEAPMQVNHAFLSGMFVSCFFSVGVLSLVGLLAFFALARALAVDRAAQVLATLAYGLGSLAFPYATLLYGHQLCGSLLLVCAALLFEQRRAARWQPWRCALAGLAGGWAVVTEYPAAVAVAGLALVCLAAPSRRRAFGWFAVGGAGPALLLAWYDTVCFGAPWASGYEYVADPTFAAGMSRGLLGLTHPRLSVLWALLVGSYRGLLLLSPILFVGFVALVRMWRDKLQLEAAACAFVVAYFLLLNASYYMWWGGSAPGPRHAIPMLGFLALPLCRLRPGALRGLSWGLLAYSMVTMLVVTLVGPEPPEAADPALAFHWQHLFADEVAVNSGSSNLGLRLGLTGVRSVLPLVVVWTACSVALWSWARDRRAPSLPAAELPGAVDQLR
jgi:hypothetical protein